MPVDRDRLRDLSAAFPTGVMIVTAVGEDGAPRGLTSQAFIGLSTTPPLMLVSVDKTSRTLAALQHSGKFVINFLKAGTDDLVRVFASKVEDKFKGVPWEPSWSAGGAPILREASVAYAECHTTQTIEAGDHWIFVGSVEGGEVLGGVPLMYYQRTYAAWPEEKPGPRPG